MVPGLKYYVNTSRSSVEVSFL